jgi:hypothetical protein
MNRWDKQHVAGWARTNITEWTTFLSIGRARGRGQDGRIRKVLQGIAAQVCMDVYNEPMIFLNSLQIEECNSYVQGVQLICLFSE